MIKTLNWIEPQLIENEKLLVLVDIDPKNLMLFNEGQCKTVGENFYNLARGI